MSHVAPDQQAPRVHCHIDGAIGWLLIDNRKRRNAMSFSMWQDLDAGTARLEADRSVRAVILAGADDRDFCAGGDISEFTELRAGAAALAEYDVVGKAAMARLQNLEKPTIAMIQGYCLGGGMALAAICDLRIAAEDARLGIPAAKRGLSYDYPGLRRLVDLVGPSEAKRMMFTGRTFNAADMCRMGFVSEVVPGEQLREHVIALATEIAGNAPLSVAASKFIINMILHDEAEHDPAACQRREAECLSSADYAEATRSFLEKRPPVFRGC